MTDELKTRGRPSRRFPWPAGSISRGNKSSSSSGGKSATAPNRTIVNTAKHVTVTVIAWAFPLRGLFPYSLITFGPAFQKLSRRITMCKCPDGAGMVNTSPWMAMLAPLIVTSRAFCRPG